MTGGEPPRTPLLDELARDHAHPRCDTCRGDGIHPHRFGALCDCVVRQVHVDHAPQTTTVTVKQG